MTYTPTTQGVSLAATFPRALTLGAPCHLSLDEFNRWLTEHTRQTAERAWHQGFTLGEQSGAQLHPINPHVKNPYRSQP